MIMDHWAAAAIAGWLLIEVIKFFVTRKMSEEQEVAKNVRELKDMHTKTDDTGRLVWYVPKELLDNQSKALDKLYTIHATTNDSHAVMVQLLPLLREISFINKQILKELEKK